MVNVSFPGLGIGEMEINPIAFENSFLNVRWYGIIITCGMILAFLYCSYRTKQEGISFDSLLDIGIFTIIFGVLGARAYYVITSWSDHEYNSFYDVIAIWEGGLAIYGGIIAGALTIYCVCRYKKIKPLKVLDSAAPAVMIGQLIGRWGNFMNGEAHGAVVSENSLLYFLRMRINPYWLDGKKHYAYAEVHPTFLYESLWNLLGFVIINALYKKKKFDGQILLMYIAWYGFGRMLIEGLRTDSLYVGVFRISQLIGFLCFLVGTTLLIINFLRIRKHNIDNQKYIPTYAKISRHEIFDPEAIESEDAVSNNGENQQTFEDKLTTEEISEKIQNLFNNNSDSEV